MRLDAPLGTISWPWTMPVGGREDESEAAAMAAPTFGRLDLSIIGLGVQYPAHSLGSDPIDCLSSRFYAKCPALNKVLCINRVTGIDCRASIGTADHPLVNQAQTPSIRQLHETFMAEGVPLAVAAASKALGEAGVTASEVSHMVSATCTGSANPGFDHFVARRLGMGQSVERVLLHGVGCSGGGLAALRTAASLALAATALGRPARVLCLTLELSTVLVRSELDSICERQEVRVGICLFSDCASAAVLSNGLGPRRGPAVYDLVGWHHALLPGTEDDLGFDVDASGWKLVLTARVPALATAMLAPAFERLKASLCQPPSAASAAADFDWALHPGGISILSGAEEALAIPPALLRASYDVYVRHGNSSSATIFSVLDRLRSRDMDHLAPDGGPRRHVVGCVFGPGISIEMCLLKRNMRTEDGGDGGGSSPCNGEVAELLDQLELD